MEFKEIKGFPGYSVSNMGRIRNDRTDRIMALTINSHGVVQVGLMKDGRQFKRGVALLVAQAFLPPPKPSTFDTPINLDGDRTNNEITNLMWRPRWFAVKYHKQFEFIPPMSIERPLVETQTGFHFKNSFDASTQFGLLDSDIGAAVVNRTYVWPTYQIFKIVAH